MRKVRGKLWPFAVPAVAAFPVLYGCHQFQTHDTLASVFKERSAPAPAPQLPKPNPEPGTETALVAQVTAAVPPKPEPRPVSKELGPIEPPAPSYIVDAPDVLQIEVTVKDPQTGKENPLAKDPISGTFVVRPDGSVVLGEWGSVSVAGRTPDEAAERIRDYLAKARGADSDGELRVTVAVKDRGSKRYYVILTGAAGGEQAYAFPLNGTERVLDAIAYTPGVGWRNRPLSIQVIRKGLPGKDTVLRVDWRAMMEKWDPATNYPLQPDDKVFVTCE